MNKILLVDLNSWEGHHRPYFLMYARAFLELNYKVDVLCLGEEDIKSHFIQELQNNTLNIRNTELSLHQKITLRVLNYIGIITSTSFPSIMDMGRWLLVKNSAKLSGFKNESFVFILDLQGYLVEIPKFLRKYLLPHSWAGLYIWDPPNYQLIHDPSCRGLFLLNEHLVKALKNDFQDMAVYHLPDISYVQCYSEEPSLVLDLRKIASGRKIVFLSSLTKKHGLIEFLRLADEMFGSNILFFAMGLVRLEGYGNKELEYINSRLLHPPDNLLVWKEIYPPEETLNALYQSADIAFICYPNFHNSSNKLTKAIALKTPVLVAENTLLADRVKRYQLGHAVNTENPLDMANAVNKLLHNFQFDEIKRKAFVDLHSEETLKSRLAKAFL